MVHLNLSPIIGFIPHPSQEIIRWIGFPSVLILFAEAFKITCLIIFWVSTTSNFNPKVLFFFLKHFSHKSILGFSLHLYLLPIIGLTLQPSQVAKGCISFLGAFAFFKTIFFG